MKNSERKKQNVLSVIDRDKLAAKKNPHAEQIARLELQKELLITEKNDIKKIIDKKKTFLSSEQICVYRQRLRFINADLKEVKIKIDLLS